MLKIVLRGLLLALLLKSPIAFSQPTVFLSGNDTVIQYSLPQARFLLKEPHKVKQLENDKAALILVSKNKDTIIHNDSTTIAAQGQIICNQWDSETALEKIRKIETDHLKKDKRIERRKKWIAYAVTAAVLAYEIKRGLMRN